MSHVATVNLVIKDLAALKAACADLGLEFRENQRQYRWYGRSVGALPPGMTLEELGQCTHAIAIPGDAKAYEIGVRAQPNGTYTLVWDFWNGGYGLQAKVGKDCNTLKQKYSARVVATQARRMGLKMVQRVKSDGSIEITLEG